MYEISSSVGPLAPPLPAITTPIICGGVVAVMEDKRTVFVKLVAAIAGYSVPRYVTESDFINHFATLKRQIEEISSIRGRNAAHAFLKFKTPEAASEAIAGYNDTYLRGRYKIIVRRYRNGGSYSPATSADTRQSGTEQQPRQQHPLVGSPVTRKSSLKQENVQQQHKQQQHQISQPKVHSRRGRAPTSTNPQISQPPRQVSSADASSKFNTVAVQQKKSSIVGDSITQQKKSSAMDNYTAQQKKSSAMDNSIAQQKKSSAMDNSAAPSLVADNTVKQESSINVDSQDTCPWPDVASKPIFLTEPDDGMLSGPDSSRRPSLKDLLLNPASSANGKPYEQSHSCPVPLASAGSTSSHPSSSPTFIRVAITNLSTEADEDDLIPFLGPTGKLINLALVNDDSSKAATVAYPSLADAQKAVMKWHGSIIYGLPVCVEVIRVVTQTPSLPTPPVSLDGEYTLPPSLSSILQSLLLATVSEYQRFLSRISNHRVLRCNHHVVTFLTASPEVTPPPLYTDQSYCSYYRSCVQFVLNSIAMSRVRWCIVLPRGGGGREGV